MKIRDYFPNYMTEGTFFNEFIQTFPWVSSDNVNLLNMAFIGKYGDRETSAILDEFKKQTALPELWLNKNIADYLELIFKTNWDHTYLLLSSQYNPIENYDMQENENSSGSSSHSNTHSMTRTDTGTIGNVNSSTTDNTVYGFNSEDGSPSDSSMTNGSDAETRNLTQGESGSDSVTESNNNGRILTRHGNIGVTTTQQMMNQEVEFWKWNFINSVMQDIASILTCPIY